MRTGVRSRLHAGHWALTARVALCHEGAMPTRAEEQIHRDAVSTKLRAAVRAQRRGDYGEVLRLALDAAAHAQWLIASAQS